ncbi:MAG: aminotransferase class I/II-fold pyridoxal phosphate-dependent enzyme [Aestuariivita sp.]|nr:aminotransferase class I/II-fold pyridoxal phosphate-dependent enzyme [Aestuariivita sp.]
MLFPERFKGLPSYAFPRLRALLKGHEPGGDVIDMTIGEPRHIFPSWVKEIIFTHINELNSYPDNEGCIELRHAISNWISRRYGVFVNSETQVMALNGSREGLYNAAIALCPETKNGAVPLVLCPNPFYPVYMVAAISVGAEPYFVPAVIETGNLPDYSSLSPEILNRTVIAYVCSPSNPQGAVATESYWIDLIELAEKYDFKIFADECYSEIYREKPPIGALEVASAVSCDPDRVLVFHSLSKRSNLPGLRSGFVAGGQKSIKRCKLLRSYSGAPLSTPLQVVAAKVWADEVHVCENRELYQEKYKISDNIFGSLPNFAPPEGGFFLWLPVKDGEATAQKLWREVGIRVLPGAYLSQDINGKNPGMEFIRVAMVATKKIFTEGLNNINDCLYA